MKNEERICKTFVPRRAGRHGHRADGKILLMDLSPLRSHGKQRNELRGERRAKPKPVSLQRMLEVMTLNFNKVSRPSYL